MARTLGQTLSSLANQSTSGSSNSWSCLTVSLRTTPLVGFLLSWTQQFQACLAEWVNAISEVFQGQIIAVDGKTLRRSHDKAVGKQVTQMVSAWADQNRLVLGQMKVDEQSNEITTIPELLALLEIEGCIVTTDAIGCQKAIAQTIVDQNADYVLAGKENQGHLYETFQDLFQYPAEMVAAGCDYYKTVNKGHGRIEVRECWTTSDPAYLRYISEQLSEWPGLRSLVMVKSERSIVDGERTIKCRYFISSLDSNARLALHAARTHWEIENKVHWILDIAVLRHIALNLLKQKSQMWYQGQTQDDRLGSRLSAQGFDCPNAIALPAQGFWPISNASLTQTARLLAEQAHRGDDGCKQG
jgi:predicted transposase YbfD/YdcC